MKTTTTILSLVAAATLLFHASHRASARIPDELDAIADLALLVSGENQDSGRRLRVNGLSVNLSTGTTDRDIPDLLDRFKRRCARDRADHGQDDESTRPSAPMLKWSVPTRGVAVCIANGTHPTGLAGWLQRIRAFFNSRDLADVGEFRFLRATRDNGRTAFVTMQLPGPLPIGTWMPSEHDAPGADLPGIPRPLNAVRTLTANETGTTPKLVVYRSRDPDASEHYLNRAHSLGFAANPIAGHPGTYRLLRTSARHPGSAIMSIAQDDSHTTFLFAR